jgi:hypothetical protein
MNMFGGNLSIVKNQITVSHGASVAAATGVSTVVPCTDAQVGDRPYISPAAVPATGIIVGQSPTVTTAGSITVCIANVTTATVSAGTAVVYNVELHRPTGPSTGA